MLQWAKRLLLPKTSQDGIELERHEAGGHAFFSFPNPMAIPTARRMAWYHALHSVALQVRAQDLDTCIDLMRAKMNAHDFTAAAYLLETLDAYRKLYTSASVVFEVADCVVLMQGESPYEPSATYSKRKRELCESSPDVLALFFSLSNRMLRPTEGEVDPMPSADYLARPKVRKVENQFLRSIGQHIWPTSPAR